MRVNDIKLFLRQNNLDAYLVSHGNRFIGEDILDSEHKIKHLCGFSGSDGLLIISRQKCFLLVDGRYELQALMETDASQVTIIHQNPTLLNAAEILRQNQLTNIGYDAWCQSAAEMKEVAAQYSDLHFADCSDLLQIDSRKPIKILQRDIAYAGQSSADKMRPIKQHLQQQNADYLLLTSANSVSWLFNIYAQDLPYTPIVRAYALIDNAGNFTLFADNLQTDLSHKNMQDLISFLQKNGTEKIIYDASTTPQKLVFPHMQNVFDICQNLKAIKNKTELNGMIESHIRDGAALSKLLFWLEKNKQNKTELEVVQKLHEFRIEQNLFFSESFATIAGVGSNGAVVHYQPNEQTNRALEENQLLLLDSGGQYLDGTTDVTRTIVLGEPQKQQIKHFTMVLKAHIALANTVFSADTTGAELDDIARRPLRQKNMDFKHGTGHGVACFGNVHEGPVSISSRCQKCFTENMVTSIEPGFYLENQYGIRIENLYYTQAQKDGRLHFIYLTKVPIDKRLIDKYMLSADEQNWLNKYHACVYKSLQQYMTEEEKQWLEEACSPL